MKVLKIILGVILIVVALFFLLIVDFKEAQITDIRITKPVAIQENEDTSDTTKIYVNISDFEYYFTQKNPVFLNKENKKINASDLKIGDYIQILRLRLDLGFKTDFYIEGPEELDGVLLVKKIN